MTPTLTRPGKLAKSSVRESFPYRYEFTISTEFWQKSSSLVVKYFDSKKRKLPYVFEESATGFQRKLLFNFLKALDTDCPADETAERTITATYYYVVVENGGFVFCCDAVDNMLASQYIFNTQDTSTIQEYLVNLGRVEYLISRNNFTKALTPDERAKLGDWEEPLFGKGAWPSLAGSISDKVTLRRNDDGTITFKGNASLNRYPLGEFATVLPIPEFSQDPQKLPVHALVVGCWRRTFSQVRAEVSRIASGGRIPRSIARSIRSALEETTRILWGDDGRVVWIMGEPGSGKEVFAQALHYGARRAVDHKQSPTHSDKVTDGMSSQSIAGITLAELNQRLYGAESHGADCVLELVDQVHGTVFLDEFDKPKEGREIYSALLRVLEAKQFIKRDVSDDQQRIIEKPATCKNVNWILAGAFSQTSPRDAVPSDLWSRLTGFIHLRNPLQEDDNYGGSLFLFAYLRLAARLLNRESIEPLMAALNKSPDARNYTETIACKLLGESNAIDPNCAFVPSKSLGRLAENFQHRLRTKSTFTGDRLDTARGVIKATEAAFKHLQEAALNSPEFSLTKNMFREAALEEAHKALRLSRGPL
jgi:hypothetical protein